MEGVSDHFIECGELLYSTNHHCSYARKNRKQTGSSCLHTSSWYPQCSDVTGFLISQDAQFWSYWDQRGFPVNASEHIDLHKINKKSFSSQQQPDIPKIASSPLFCSVEKTRFGHTLLCIRSPICASLCVLSTVLSCSYLSHFVILSAERNLNYHSLNAHTLLHCGSSFSLENPKLSVEDIQTVASLLGTHSQS